MDWGPASSPKLDFNECFYSVLEAPPTATSTALKKAYYQMVFKYHPDNIKDKDPDGAMKRLRNQQMMVINAAYKVLRDPQLRTVYDKQRSAGLTGAKAKMPKGGSPSTASTTRKPPATGTEDPREDYYSDVDEMGWRKKPRSSDTDTAAGQRRRYTDQSDDEWEVNEMGWRVKKTQTKSQAQSQTGHQEGRRYEDEASDLDEMLRQGWFDADLKNRLLQRRRERAGSNSSSRPMSVFEEIKELLREDDRSRATRSGGQDRDAYRAYTWSGSQEELRTEARDSPWSRNNRNMEAKKNV